MADSLDLASLRDWIGREEGSTDVLTPSLAERLRVTLGLPGEAPAVGEAAPRLIHLCLGQPALPATALEPSGHPRRGGFLPPVPLPRRMWAGGAFRFAGDLLVGQTVTRLSRIADVVLKKGRSGLLCFVEVDHEVAADGVVRVRERQSLVYRAPSSSTAAPLAPPAPTGAHVEELAADAVLLFRYSALTFNGHRIHYDLAYAREAEGYPGLVVHGPLQATLLYSLAARRRGSAPDDFAFRSHSPLFDNRPVLLHCAEPDGQGLDLWTAAPGGPIAMQARASW